MCFVVNFKRFSIYEENSVSRAPKIGLKLNIFEELLLDVEIVGGAHEIYFCVTALDMHVSVF